PRRDACAAFAWSSGLSFVSDGSRLTGVAGMYIDTKISCQPPNSVRKGGEGGMGMTHRIWRLARLGIAGAALITLGAVLFGMSAVARPGHPAHHHTPAVKAPAV